MFMCKIYIKSRLDTCVYLFFSLIDLDSKIGFLQFILFSFYLFKIINDLSVNLEFWIDLLIKWIKFIN